MVELIISEKPNAAKKIAEALADGKAIKMSDKGVNWYQLSHNKKDIIVGCAVGHLYGLKSNERGFPIFNIDWVPNYEVSKGADFSKKYIVQLKKLVKQCDEFTVATDFDIEGEVIGLNVVREIAKKKDANRMKFSTLTKDELVKAYENKQKHLDWGQANAGETRHKLDWYYGINLSRALTKAISKAGMFTLLSTGRVQGPALKLLVDKDKEISKFKPTPYWEIELEGKLNSYKIVAQHEKGKIKKEEDAKKILENTQKQKAELKDINKREFKQNPPNPFDLTSLQIEAHTKLGISPKQTLAIAQELYTSGFISYPRTSSQKLPKSIEYKKILTGLAQQEHLSKHCQELLGKKTLKPNEGKKDDPAHPAIYPTGILPNVKDREARLYELIARRFLAVFGEPAIKETATYTIDCNKENFLVKGTVVKEKGWLEYYGRFGEKKDEQLPPANKGDEVKTPKITKLDKETTPPKRYTEASIIKELEKRNLGTKATRAQIIDTLFNRKYLEGKQLKVTELGLKVENILESYCPLITDEEMTRSFEEEMEKIREEKEKPEKVLKKAQDLIKKIVKEFADKEEKVGEGLKKTFQETRDKQETLGKCPNCKEGMIKIRKGKFGRFAACSAYPDCKTTYSLPNLGTLEPVDEVCEVCGAPKAKIIRKGRATIACINPDCKTKQVEIEGEGKKCEKCGKGKMVLRRSMYGSFLGCDQYPKCKNLIQVQKKVEE